MKKNSEKIFVDARYVGLSGIGTFCKGILDNIPQNDFQNIILLGNKIKLSKLYPNVNIIDDQFNPFSLNGLFLSHNLLKIINACRAFLSPGYIIPFGIKIPIYTTICDCVFFDEPNTCKGIVDKRIKKYFYKRAIKKSEMVFTISNFSKNRIVSIFKCSKEKITIIPCGLSNDIIEFKKSHGKAKKENFFLFVGNFKPHKGIDTLLAAYRLYREKGGTNDLFLVGNKEGLHTSISTNGWDKIPGIKLKEGISNNDLFSLMASSKALIQPSRYEGFGLPPFEAMYLGTPVILNNITVFHEIYNNSGAIFFEKDDPSSLCEKLFNIENENKISLENCLNKYSFSLTVKIIKETLNDLK